MEYRKVKFEINYQKPLKKDKQNKKKRIQNHDNN